MPDDPPIRTAHIPVRRTARYAILGEPGPAVRELWIVCHGYRQLAARFLRRFAPLAAAERLILAPEALSRFYLDDDGGSHGPEARVGATWMTREDREAEIADYLAYLDALHARTMEGLENRAQVRVTALGFSQGSATASRWAGLGEARIDHLVLWAGAVAHDLPWPRALPRLREMGVWLVAGRQDRFVTEERVRMEEDRLRTGRIPCQALFYEGGHRVEEEPLLRLAETLGREWRRASAGSEG